MRGLLPLIWTPDLVCSIQPDRQRKSQMLEKVNPFSVLILCVFCLTSSLFLSIHPHKLLTTLHLFQPRKKSISLPTRLYGQYEFSADLGPHVVPPWGSLNTLTMVLLFFSKTLVCNGTQPVSRKSFAKSCNYVSRTFNCNLRQFQQDLKLASTQKITYTSLLWQIVLVFCPTF